MASWEDECPVETRTPMPHLLPEAMKLLARALSTQVEGSLKVQWLVMAVLLDVAFHGLLRPIEALSLSPLLVALPSGKLASLVTASRTRSSTRRTELSMKAWVR